MISIKQNSDTKISIIFYKTSQKIKVQVINAIINAFPENQNYLFEICGVDIDRFIEDMHSNKYLLKIDEKHRFIKNLPELLFFSKYSEDVKSFCQHIGSFNEGYMLLHILKKEIVEFCNEQHILNFIQENKLLAVEVTSDGDVLDVSCDEPAKINLILCFLNQFICV